MFYHFLMSNKEHCVFADYENRLNDLYLIQQSEGPGFEFRQDEYEPVSIHIFLRPPRVICNALHITISGVTCLNELSLSFWRRSMKTAEAYLNYE